MQLVLSLQQIEAALAGNQAALEVALQNSLIPAAVKAELLDPPDTVAAREELLGTMRQRLQAEEEAIVNQATARLIAQLQADLRSRATEVSALVANALNSGITAAVQRVYFFATVVIFCSFLAALLLPDVLLGSAPPGRRDDASPPALADL